MIILKKLETPQHPSIHSSRRNMNQCLKERNKHLSNLSLIDIVSCNNYFRTEAVLFQINSVKGIEPLATKRLNSYIHQLILYLLVNSGPLVSIKETENDTLKNLIIYYACDRLQYLRAKFTTDPIYKHEGDVEIFSCISSEDWLNVTGDEVQDESSDRLVKKSKITNHLYTMENFFKSLVFKYFAGKVVKYMYEEICERLKSARKEIFENSIGSSVTLTFSVQEMSVMLNSFFDLNCDILEDDSSQMNTDEVLYLLAVGMTTIAEYLVAEAVELAEVHSNHEVVSISAFLACCDDEELCQVISFGSLLYFPTSFVSPRDFITFCNEHPIRITYSSHENQLSELPCELHETILQYFDDLEQLLNMRLVCKYWNDIIITTEDIWKHLSFHSLIRHSLFSFATTSDLSLSNFVSVGEGKQITSYMEFFFARINPWIRTKSYFMSTNFSELCFGGSCTSFEKDGTEINLIKHESPSLETLRGLESSIYVSLHSQILPQPVRAFNAVTFPIIGKSKLGGFPDIPIEWESWFYNSDIWTANDFFVAQVNFEDMNTLISGCMLPAHGILYIFNTTEGVVKTYSYEGDMTKPCDMNRIPMTIRNSISDESLPIIFEDALFYYASIMDDMQNFERIFSIHLGSDDEYPDLFQFQFTHWKVRHNLCFAFRASEFKNKNFHSLQLENSFLL